MTRRGYYSVSCPTCAAPMSLVVTIGVDQGQAWEDVEVDEQSCPCDPDDAELEAAVDAVRRAA